jgi:precorrin-3B synthase
VGLRSIRAVLTPRIRRDDVDACPGALRLHAAADGPLARVRLPGGLLTGRQLSVIRELAEAWGDGHVELTSRANLQLRALTGAPAADLAAGLRAAGLLPSQTHELVRNIAAPSLSPPSTRALVADLDRGLCADDELATLPGRFLFAVDDGDAAQSADVAAVPAGDQVAILVAGEDAGLRVAPADVVPALLAAAHAFLDERAAQTIHSEQSAPHSLPDEPPSQAGGPPRHDEQPDPRRASADGGAPRPASRPRTTEATPTPAQVSTGGVAWRVRELAGGPRRVAARTAAAIGMRLDPEAPARTTATPAGVDGLPPDPRERDLIGTIVQPDGLVAVVALVPLGRLGAVPMRVLEKADLLVVTQWRGVVVPDLPPAAAGAWMSALADAGLEVTAGSRWAGVTACAGRPGCAKALADVRRDATAAVLGQVARHPDGAGRTRNSDLSDDDRRHDGQGQGHDSCQAAGDGELPVHWVGCARGCGSPGGAHVRVEATGEGYQVTGAGFAERVGADAVDQVVAAARRS